VALDALLCARVGACMLCGQSLPFPPGWHPWFPPHECDDRPAVAYGGVEVADATGPAVAFVVCAGGYAGDWYPAVAALVARRAGAEGGMLVPTKP